MKGFYLHSPKTINRKFSRNNSTNVKMNSKLNEIVFDNIMRTMNTNHEPIFSITSLLEIQKRNIIKRFRRIDNPLKKDFCHRLKLFSNTKITHYFQNSKTFDFRIKKGDQSQPISKIKTLCIRLNLPVVQRSPSIKLCT